MTEAKLDTLEIRLGYVIPRVHTPNLLTVHDIDRVQGERLVIQEHLVHPDKM